MQKKREERQRRGKAGDMGGKVELAAAAIPGYWVKGHMHAVSSLQLDKFICEPRYFGEIALAAFTSQRRNSRCTP